jgi:serine/threonine protein kinase
MNFEKYTIDHAEMKPSSSNLSLKLENIRITTENDLESLVLAQPQQQGRRSSVLRRMSVGLQIDPSNDVDSLKKYRIDIHKSETHDDVLSEDSYEDCEKINDIPFETSYKGSEYDSELYKRSDSKTDACKISDFERLRVLGQGAYGKVLLVRNKRTEMLFAQKELKKASVIISDKSIERTMSERSILSKITSHQNIVKLFYALHDRSKLYLLMEYIPGGELFKYLVKEKFLNEQKTSFYIIQMSMALKFLHNLGVIYRDLKPENCMLDKDGYLVLTDFGLAKKSTDEEDSNSKWCNSIIGTPEYVAPEVLKGENYGNSADWWSLGCVTFDLLTGNPPFTGNNQKKIMDRVIKEKPKYPFYVTSTSIEVLNKLLNKNPAKRFDVDAEWEKFQKFQFFRHYKFKDIEARKVTPPIQPIITNPEDAENFDDEFRNMKLSDLDVGGLDIANGKEKENIDCFTGFSYTATNSFVDNYTLSS